MICTSVTPCLSIGLAKDDKIISMFVLFSQLFGDFESLRFFENGRGEEDKPYTKAVRHDILVKF